MKKTYFLLLSVGLFCGLSVHAAEDSIKLSARKDLVIASHSREVVLKVAATHLGKKDEGYLASIGTIENPFTFEAPVQAPSRVIAPTVPVISGPQRPTTIVYDDASVLKVVAASFSQQVAGTLARGTKNYIQLRGGSLLKPGSKFPAEARGQTFTVTLEAVDSQGYTLRLGDATETRPFENAPASGTPGVTKYND
jgi:hypothetical protein